MAYTPAISSIVYRHQRWHIRQPALQRKVRERNLKVREPSFVPSIRVSGEKTRMKDDFLHPIRNLGEEPRTADEFCGLHPGTWGEIPDEQYTLVLFWAKSGQAVSKNDVKDRFLAPLIPETAPKRSRSFRTCNPQGQSRIFYDT